jgi:hypothetical protein
MNLHSFETHDDLENVLFGHSAVRLCSDDSGVLADVQPIFVPDGVWGPNQKTAISGVLYAPRLYPWTAARFTPEL